MFVLCWDFGNSGGFRVLRVNTLLHGLEVESIVL